MPKIPGWTITPTERIPMATDGRFALVGRIIALSQSKDWDTAKLDGN